MIERWGEYFESLLNAEYDGGAYLTSLGRGDETSRKIRDRN